jgi:hypothetical protein
MQIAQYGCRRDNPLIDAAAKGLEPREVLGVAERPSQ